ncbi:hypothetical protein [Cupriavidus pauculus]|uniref:hypothetical protein n=1 Tax=Cupriavidus pauculus TaxID=82633 RepID=UPI0038578FAA
MTRQRSKAGGQTGMNGEWYPAGTFLPATRLPKRGASGMTSRTRRGLIAPGQLAEIPEDKAALFARIQHFVVPLNDEGTTLEVASRFVIPGHPAIAAHFSSFEELQQLVERYNRGERFVSAAPGNAGI